jgi:arsenite/tail-anchored protein-transporting ATPase
MARTSAAGSSPRFSFFAGKGGAGKTTCAAAFALGQKGKTLLVSTDPAHSLGDALGQKLSRTPRRVAGGLFACELDADRALTRWFGERKRAFRVLASRGTYLDEEDIDELLETSLPGVDEMVGLIELVRLSQGYDGVVVDTAPTGHTLRLLAMPRTLATLARVLDDLSRKHRYLSESLGGSYLPDASDRVALGIESQAEELSALVKDEARCGFHLVLLAEALSVEEARDAASGISALGGTIVELVVNAVRPRPPGRCAFCDGKRRAQGEALLRARAAFPGVALRLVGEAEAEPTGVAALRKLSRSRVDAPPKRAARRPAPSGAPDPPEWPSLLAPDGVRLVLFGGKGGVGKTTCAATCALELAARGRHVLLLSTDPAHSLSDVFAVPVGDEEREIAPRLFVRELDADRAFAAERDKYRRSVEELFDALRGSSSFEATFDRQVVRDLIDLSPPGIDELFGLFAVIDALPSSEVVVVDTAPTGHALRLLALPQKALSWVHAILTILLKYRRVIGLGDLARTLTATARSLRALGELLVDPAGCRFVPVTRAARLPVLETRRLLRSLRELRIQAGPILVNAATPPGCPRCRRASRREIALRKGLGSRTGGMLIAPALPEPPRGPEALLSFGRGWARA